MADATQCKKIKEYFAVCYEKTQAKVDCAYSGMAEAMRKLYSKGFILAILSNKPDKLVKMIVNNIFPDGIISESMGQTDLPKKPDPYLPLLIASIFGISPDDTYFIGDSEVDYMTAANSGTDFIAVAWGYRDVEFLKSLGAEKIAYTPADIPEMI